VLIGETDVLLRICIQNKKQLLDWEMFTQNLVRSDMVLDRDAHCHRCYSTYMLKN